jgi:hypothetical protein
VLLFVEHGKAQLDAAAIDARDLGGDFGEVGSLGPVEIDRVAEHVVELLPERALILQPGDHLVALMTEQGLENGIAPARHGVALDALEQRRSDRRIRHDVDRVPVGRRTGRHPHRITVGAVEEHY